MALNVRKFVRGNTSVGSPSKGPKKIVADEDAFKGRRYTTIEPPNHGSQRGAFSTDLESYPDTSTDGTQLQFVNPAHLHNGTSLAEVNGQTGNGGHDYHQNIQDTPERQTRSQPVVASRLNTQQVVSAALGAGHTQDFEDFSRQWDEGADELAGILDLDDSILNNPPETTRTQATMPPPPRPVEAPIQRSLPVHQPPATQPPSVAQRGHRDGHVNGYSTTQPQPRVNPAPPRFARPQPPQDLDNGFEYSRRTTTVNPQREEIPDSQDQHAFIDDNLSDILEKEFSEPLSQDAIAEGNQPSPKKPSIQDRWSLKRKASMEDVEIGKTDQELLSTPYASLDGEEDHTADDSVLESLEEIIASIIKNDYDEDQLLSNLAKLSQDNWAKMGDILSDESTKAMNELKAFRNKKRTVSTKYEEDIQKMMKQVETNDQGVDNRLNRLREFGVKMLGDSSPSPKKK